MSYNAQLQSKNARIQALIDKANNLPDADGDVSLQSKTVTPSTAKQTITADSGYSGLSTVTVQAMPTAEQATPTISINANGLIKATTTQAAGYVSGGTKTATEQLTTQGAQTITPGTTNKTIASGRYLTGTQTIKGDSNLIAGNIKSGVSIFGVSGSYTGSGGSSGGDSGDGIQSVTVTIENSNLNGHVWYTDASYTFITQQLSGAETLQITCIKNTPVIFSGYGFGANIQSSFEINYMAEADMQGMYIYHFSNNTTIVVENVEGL